MHGLRGRGQGDYPADRLPDTVVAAPIRMRADRLGECWQADLLNEAARVLEEGA